MDFIEPVKWQLWCRLILHWLASNNALARCGNALLCYAVMCGYCGAAKGSAFLAQRWRGGGEALHLS